MPGTRVAPPLTGAATSILLSVHWIDDSGDIWSEAHVLPVGTSLANQEAYLDALQLVSAASMYKVESASVWGTDGLADPSNAQIADGFAKSRSVFDSLNMTLKHSTDPDKKNKIVRVPAPLAELFENDFVDTDPLPPNVVSDTPSNESVNLLALGTIAQTIFAGYTVAWVRYSEKAELNEKKRL